MSEPADSSQEVRHRFEEFYSDIMLTCALVYGDKEEEGKAYFDEFMNAALEEAGARKSPRKEIKKLKKKIDAARKKGQIAARILSLLISMRRADIENPSFRKACAILLEEYNAVNGERWKYSTASERTIQNAWEEYRNAAHIWLALDVLELQRAENNEEGPRPIEVASLANQIAVAVKKKTPEFAKEWDWKPVELRLNQGVDFDESKLLPSLKSTAFDVILGYKTKERTDLQKQNRRLKRIRNE